MKYLKKFNESMIDTTDVNHIMYELSDYDYIWAVNTHLDSKGRNEIVVEIEGKLETFISGNTNYTVKMIHYKEIVDTINRLDDYLSTQGYKQEIHTMRKKNGMGYSDANLEMVNKVAEEDLQVGGPAYFKFKKV